MRIARWLAAILITCTALGCGKGAVTESETTPGQSGPTVAKESPGDATTPAEDRDSFPIVNAPALELPVTPESTPEEVVTEFLNAMRTGNDGVAAGLLTATAREETAKHGLAVQPPGSPAAQYEVTEGEISADDPSLAQVGCVWAEADATGKEQSEQVIWVLRKQEEGWRVCGMATQMPTREEPVFFDFEDPAEMTALMDRIAEEMVAAESESPMASDSSIRSASNPEEENSLRK